MAKNQPLKDIHRKGYSNLKTAIKHNLATKSRPMRSGYLEMFIIDKHRSRLLQERKNLTRRVNQINAELVNIEKGLSEKRVVVEQDISIFPNKDMEKDKAIDALKIMSLDY